MRALALLAVLCLAAGNWRTAHAAFARPEARELPLVDGPAGRRPDSAILTCDIALYHIDRDAQYEVSVTGETYEQGPWRNVSGAELMRPDIVIRERPGSALLRYRQTAR